MLIGRWSHGGLLLVTLLLYLSSTQGQDDNMEQAALFGAQQSSTYPGHDASNAIDGEAWTFSQTGWGYDSWFSVDMPVHFVKEVVLRAGTNVPAYIEVTLFKDGSISGYCDSHPADYSLQTLECHEVYADRMNMSMTSEEVTRLTVFEIAVRGDVLTITIDQCKLPWLPRLPWIPSVFGTVFLKNRIRTWYISY